MTILRDLSSAQLIAEIARLQAENDRLNAKRLGLKVSAKGAVSLYGMGKWPVTLYAEQWAKVLDKADEIRAFIEANRASLTAKRASQSSKGEE